VLASAAIILFFGGGFSFLPLSKAQQAVQRRDLDGADYWLGWARSLRSGSATFQLARVARLRGNSFEANRYLALASKAGFDSDRIKLERELANATENPSNETLAPLSARVANGDPDSGEICEVLANGLSRESKFGAAIQILNAWELDDAISPSPAFRLGRIDEYMERMDEAKEHYARSVKRNSEFYPALFSLGRIHLDENDAQGAKGFFEPGLKLPNNAAFKTAYAMCSAKEGGINEARNGFLEVLAMGNDRIEDAYRRLGEPSDRLLAASELGKLELAETNYLDAMKVLDLALSHNPRDITARYTRALAMRGLGRNAEADKEFERVEEVKTALQRVNILRNQIGRDLGDIEARIELGNLLIKFESERNGLFWLLSAATQDEKSVPAHVALADFYESNSAISPKYGALAKTHRDRVKTLTGSAQ